MNVNAVDLSAKLLALENISVRRARTQTASFDIKSRVLTLPMWKDMTPMVEGMLVGHEVGHALYTTEEYLVPLPNNPKLQGYLNILEDVRIEKLMKRKYPGIRKTMTQGYKELNEKDFFGVQKSDLETILLIDKINLYFKAGYDCGVKFTSEEKVFVNRAEKTETIQEVIDLAEEIYAYARAQAKSSIELGMLEEPEVADGDPDDLDEIDEDFGSSGDDWDESESDDDSEDGDDGDDYEDNRYTGGRTQEELLEDRIDAEVESKTDKILSKKLEELADDSTEFVYYELGNDYAFNPIVNYKTIISETAEAEKMYSDPVYGETTRENLNKFKVESSRIVNYLIKEFEMRKSAKMYKRSQVSKIGQLDMRKIWSYKLSDDLFKRVTSVSEGKNHGMIFLLDWSGSMQHVIQETVEQVLTLAMFCQRAQIPYQVLAFSTQYSISDQNPDMYDKIRAVVESRSVAKKTLDNDTTTFALLELLSNKMSSVEFNTMTRRLLQVWRLMHCKHNEYNLGGTPLNEGLSYMVNHIPKFIKANNIEKMSLITLTDGEGGQLTTANGHNIEEYRYVSINDTYKKTKSVNFLTDSVTKKTYRITRNASVQTEAILKLLKDRYDINSVGFYVTPNNRNNLTGVIRNNLPYFNGSSNIFIENMRKEFRDKGFASIKNTGRDDLFIVPISSMKIANEILKVEDNQTAKQIARNFSKIMNGKKTSRILLNQFIGYVA
jgi:hypothetical protein